MVLLVLALIWAAVLLPPLIRSRLEGNPADSVGRFRRHLRVLECTTPVARSLADAPVLVHPRNDEISYAMPKAWADEARRLRGIRRRRNVATCLIAAAGFTLLVGLLPMFRFLIVAHVIFDMMLAGYIFLLVRARNLEAERQMTAHFAALRNESQSTVQADESDSADLVAEREFSELRRQAF